MKKVISLILAVLLLVSVFSVNVFAADVSASPSGEKMKDPDASGTLGTNGSWKFYEDTGEMYIYGTGEMADTYNAFRKDYKSKIKYVFIAEGVTSVAGSAFMNCTNLVSVEMGMGDVEVIGTNAFYGCTSLSSLTFSEKTTSIDDSAFMGTALTSVELPSAIAYLGNKCLGYQNATTKVADFEIEGYGDTVAYDYATSNGFKFIDADSPDPIEAISLSLTEPKIDEHPSTEISVTAGEIEIESFNWIDPAESKTMTPTDTFENLKTYYAEIYVKAQNGYCFNVNESGEPTVETFSVNGEGEPSDWRSFAVEGCNPKKYALIKIVYDVWELEPVGFVNVTWDYNGATLLNASDLSPEMLQQFNETGKLVDKVLKGVGGTILPFEEMEAVPPKGKEFDHYELDGVPVKIGYSFYYDKDRTIKLCWKDAAKLNKSSASLSAGKTVALKVTNGTVKSWSSSSKAVATVTKGKVTALKKGTSTITATLTNGKKLSCKVNVTSNPKLSKTAVNVKKNGTTKISITGKASSVKNVYTNTKIAKITSKTTATTIVVKGLKKGKTTLKIKVNGYALKLRVNVK